MFYPCPWICNFHICSLDWIDLIFMSCHNDKVKLQGSLNENWRTSGSHFNEGILAILHYFSSRVYMIVLGISTTRRNFGNDVWTLHVHWIFDIQFRKRLILLLIFVGLAWQVGKFIVCGNILHNVYVGSKQKLRIIEG